MKVNCLGCKFFKVMESDTTSGYCRFLPPVRNFNGGMGSKPSVTPIVTAKDWCSKYEPANGKK